MKVFVASLDYNTVDDSALFELFSRYVDVRSAKIARDADGRSRGFGHVELLHDQDLDTALELDGINFHGRRLGVAPAKAR